MKTLVMLNTTLTHLASLLRKLALWSLALPVIALVWLADAQQINTGFPSLSHRIDGSFTIADYAQTALFIAPLALLMLWLALTIALKVLRGLDLMFTYPAVGEVISSQTTGLYVNHAPEFAVKMRIKRSDLITECRTFSFVGEIIGGEYDIRVSRLNPAVAKFASAPNVPTARDAPAPNQSDTSFTTTTHAASAADIAAISRLLPANARALLDGVTALAKASGTTMTTSVSIQKSGGNSSDVPAGLVMPEIMAQMMSASGAALTPSTATVLARHEVSIAAGSPGAAPGGLWDVTLDVVGDGTRAGYTTVLRMGFSSAERRDAIAHVGATLPLLVDPANQSRVTIDTSRLPL